MNDLERSIRSDLMKKDWQVLRNGAPDFFCIRIHNGHREIMAVEVKSLSDKLSTAQREVHALLKQAGIPVHVVHPGDSLDFLLSCRVDTQPLPIAGDVPPRLPKIHDKLLSGDRYTLRALKHRRKSGVLQDCITRR